MSTLLITGLAFIAGVIIGVIGCLAVLSWAISDALSWRGW